MYPEIYPSNDDRRTIALTRPPSEERGAKWGGGGLEGCGWNETSYRKPGIIYVRRCRHDIRNRIKGKKGRARMAAAGSKAERGVQDRAIERKKKGREGEGRVGLAWRNVTQLSAVIGSSLVQ